MAFSEKILAQTMHTGTTALTVYTVPTSTVSIIKNIYICNTTAVPATFQLHVNGTGATYSTSTALFYDVSLGANDTLQVDGFTPLQTAGATVGFKAGTGGAFTVTCFGAEIT